MTGYRAGSAHSRERGAPFPLQGQYDLVGALLRRGQRQTEKVVESFLERTAAEAMIVECLTDEPDWVDVLSVEWIELEGGGAN